MGPYEEIEPFYHEVFGWIADKQLMPLGTMHELYYNSPDTTAREHLLTEMMVAIKN
jgi:effector-binding domain-containing protein